MRLGGETKRLLTLAATVAVISTLTWRALPEISRWNQRMLAHQIAQSIETNSQGGATEPLRRLASLGLPALDPLVVVASSQRTSVALSARQTINENFAAWQIRARTEDHFDFAAPMIELATALSAHADQFDVSGNRWAASLAIRMTHLAETLSPQEAAKLLEACDRILVSNPAQGPRLRTFPSIAQRLSDPQSKSKVPDVPFDLLAVPSEGYRDLFSQKEQRQTVKLESQVSTLSSDPDAALTKSMPPLAASHPKVAPWSADWSDQPATPAPLAAVENRLAAPLLPEFHRPLEEAAEVVIVPTPSEMVERQKTLRTLPTESLLAQLVEADRYEAGSIRIVLRERGFANSEFPLAHLMVSPRVEDRNRLIETLSHLPADNARRWLRWLLKDNEADIRLQALTALATTNDPKLFQLARELAVEDQDNRVSELASKIMRQVR